MAKHILSKTHRQRIRKLKLQRGRIADYRRRWRLPFWLRNALSSGKRVPGLVAVVGYYGLDLRFTRPHAHCVYCGKFATGFDHLHPYSEGGTDDLLNLAPCCAKCNSRKGDGPIWTMLG